jgi:hypothetical protein
MNYELGTGRQYKILALSDKGLQSGSVGLKVDIIHINESLY